MVAMCDGCQTTGRDDIGIFAQDDCGGDQFRVPHQRERERERVCRHIDWRERERVTTFRERETLKCLNGNDQWLSPRSFKPTIIPTPDHPRLGTIEILAQWFVMIHNLSLSPPFPAAALLHWTSALTNARTPHFSHTLFVSLALSVSVLRSSFNACEMHSLSCVVAVLLEGKRRRVSTLYTQ